MALTYWFGKMPDAKMGLGPVEVISLLYTALTTVAVLLLYGHFNHPASMLLGRLLIVAGTFALLFLYRRFPCRILFFVRIAFQMALLSYWYPDTYEFNRMLPNLDHLFASVEQTIFGTQPAYWFPRIFPNMWASEPLNMGYFAYYPMIAAVVFWQLFFCFKKLERTAFILVASFFVYYLIYMVLPVAGPQFYFPVIGDDNVLAGVFPSVGDYFNLHQELLPGSCDAGHGFFYGLVEHSQAVGERPTAAFPSSHVGISSIVMALAWKSSRKLFAFMMPFYVLLCMATVYIQAHYLIDVFAGWISAAVIFALSAWLYRRFFIQDRDCQKG